MWLTTRVEFDTPAMADVAREAVIAAIGDIIKSSEMSLTWDRSVIVLTMKASAGPAAAGAKS